jgi:hypothetical protein
LSFNNSPNLSIWPLLKTYSPALALINILSPFSGPPVTFPPVSKPGMNFLTTFGKPSNNFLGLNKFLIRRLYNE